MQSLRGIIPAFQEEVDGKITAYEFKWKSKKKVKFPQKFIDAYQADVKVIDTENYYEFIG